MSLFNMNTKWDDFIAMFTIDRLRNMFFDNSPDPDHYEQEDIVLVEGFGGIESSGSNSDGRWVRFADGTQICWHSINHTEPQETSSGALYRTADSTTWTFPQAFLTGSGRAFFESASTYRWPQKSSAGHSTEASYHIFRTTSSDFGGIIHAFAIGRWR